MRWVLNGYLKLLTNHPWKITCITSGVLTGTGDVIAQQLIEKVDTHDLRRNTKMACLGLFFTGPAQFKMYLTVDKLWPLSDRRSIVKKVVATQLLWAPFIIGSIFVMSDLLDGRTMEEMEAKLRTSYLRTLRTGYMLWPAAQLVIFTYVPLNLRGPITNCIALFWNTYLTWTINKKVDFESNDGNFKSEEKACLHASANECVSKPLE